MIGKTIAHYQILDKLGEGGMGVVYKARDAHLDRLVALKALPPEKVADPERKRRFVQEAKARGRHTMSATGIRLGLFLKANYLRAIIAFVSMGWTIELADLRAESALSTSCSSPTFEVAPFFAVGGESFSVAVGDFNRDGWPDLATSNILSDTNVFSNSVSVLLSRGDGGFRRVDFEVGMGPYSLAVGDFNHDGRPDLVTANYGSKDLSVLLGHGNGSFSKARTFNVGMTAYSVAVADLNRDGKDDLAVTGTFPNDGAVQILLGRGDGTFSTPSALSGFGQTPLSIAVSDFNLDGRPDLAVAGLDLNIVSVLLGNGDGSFQPALTTRVGTAPRSVVVGDFDLDGRPDLATANDTSHDVTILLGYGNGRFRPGMTLKIHGVPRALVVDDFDLDGHADLAATFFDGVSLWFGQGDGRFSDPVLFQALNSRALAAGDFNRDGQPDLGSTVGGDQSLGTINGVTILLGKGNGLFKAPRAFPAFRAGENRGIESVAVGDFNRDGRPDLVTLGGGGSVAVPFNNVSLLLGRGDGSFQRPRQFYVGGGRPNFLAVADFDGDGYDDVAATSIDSHTLSVLLGTKNGGFRPALTTKLDGFAFKVVIADFNLDGHLDLAAMFHGDQTGISILLGRGNGTFRKGVTLSAGFEPQNLVVGYFNFDRRPDLAVKGTDDRPDHLAVLLNLADGTFSEPITVDIGSAPLSIAVGDFNNDGHSDLAVATLGESGRDPGVSVLLGGNGTFRRGATYSFRVPPSLFVPADLNLDGNLDLIVGHQSLLLGSGNGTFRRVSIPNLTARLLITVGDFNLDRRPDLVSINFNDFVAITLSTCGLPTSGDVQLLAPVE